MRLAGPVNPVPATLSLDATGTVIRLVPTAPLVANTSYCYYVYWSQPVVGHQRAAGAGDERLLHDGDGGADGGADGGGGQSGRRAGGCAGERAGAGGLQRTDRSAVGDGGDGAGGVSGQPAVPAALSFSDSNRLVQVTPQGVLPAGTLLTVTVDGVTDVAGNAVPPPARRRLRRGTRHDGVAERARRILQIRQPTFQRTWRWRLRPTR